MEVRESLAEAAQAVDFDAAVETVSSGEEQIAGIRRDMSYDFRLMSSLHIAAPGSFSRCRELGVCDPASVLADYQDARNARDTDALVALYAEDALITGHPLDDDGEADVEEIRAMESAVAQLDPVRAVTRFLNIEVDGTAVTFDERFTNHSGCFAATGNEMIVEGGKITRLKEYTDTAAVSAAYA